jgi:serine/threonine protein kinase
MDTQLSHNKSKHESHVFVALNCLKAYTVCLSDSTARFHIKVSDEDMTGTTFAEFRTKNEPVHFKCAAWEKLCSHLIPTCVPQLTQLEQSLPQTSFHFDTIYDYYRAPHFSMRIVACGTAHTAELISGPTHASICHVEPVPVDTPSLLPGLPFFDAHKVCTIPESSDPYAVPSKVQEVNGKIQFFKPCIYAREPDFAREVSLLCQMQELGLRKELNISHLLGIVTVNEDKEVVGMLLEWIPGRVLADAACIHDRGQHKKWKMQIEHIIKRLHSYDIVWGDVNPHNIMINLNGARAIDFGGRCNVAFIDEKNMETKDGDWQGVHKIFDEWLPADRRDE